MQRLRIALVVLVGVASARAQVTERVSIGANGVEAELGVDLPSPPGAVVSRDGRYVAFTSAAASLVSGDTNATWDVFLRDRLNGITERVSVDSNGSQANGVSGSFGIALSGDGRYVAFDSRASNLVAGDTNGMRDIFVRDRLLGTTERVSVDSGGVEANADSFHLSISPDARFVAFESLASNLVVGDSNAKADVFTHDRVSGATDLASIATSGSQGNADSLYPSITPDGRLVAFASQSSNLVTGDTNLVWDVFVRDRQLGLTWRVNLSTSGVQGNDTSFMASISADGRYVVFMSKATNLVTGDTNARDDVFLRDRALSTTVRLSVTPGNIQGDGHSTEPSLSEDARYVAFKSSATNLVPNGLTAITFRVLVHDRLTGTNEIASLATDGHDPSTGGAADPWISADGRFVAFESNSTDLVPGDTNGTFDVFIHDRFAAGFTTLCDPGNGTVIACPCANPPASLGRGCDNSSSTGGASLSASGIAYLAQDSLVFTTNGEKPSATSILLQGTAVNPTGSVLGQGVRCADGVLKRLYVKTAAGGSISAPDFGAGDPTVSARSAQLGVQLQPGQAYSYLVYYRDPIVLNGCPAASTFNSTQSGSVSWWP